MIRFLKGSWRNSLSKEKRVHWLPALIIFTFILTGCTGRIANVNWPGLSTNGQQVFLAYGPGVIAYDVEAETPAWTFPLETNQSLQFYAAPSVEDGRVVIGDYGAAGGFFSPNVVVTVYALENGQQGTPQTLWFNDDVAKDHVVAPPLQVGNQAFVGTSDGYILALNAETGALQWRFKTEHSVWGQPSYQDGVLFVASLDKVVYALDAAEGTELWRAELDGALASQPVVDSSLVYVSSFDRKLHALDMATGEEQWAAEAQDWVWGAAALADDVVYFADIQGNVYAVTADTGESLWTHQVMGAVQASPVVVGDLVYVASEGDRATEEGRLTALSAEDGQEVWQMNTPAPLHTTPVVADNSIVVALQSESALLMAFDLATGSQQWTFAPPSPS
jgi:outer membrane protein assembly factor BamB